MPSSDYTAATGGALKLKGSHVTKKKKKKPKQPAAEGDDAKASAEPKQTTTDPGAQADADETDGILSKGMREEEASLRQEIEKELKQTGRPKTEAEKRFEEQRRKRLEDRLKRDGVKTHKERVEELNRYLSKLSEHHDMYVLVLSMVTKVNLISILQAENWTWLMRHDSLYLTTAGTPTSTTIFGTSHRSSSDVGVLVSA